MKIFQIFMKNREQFFLTEFSNNKNVFFWNYENFYQNDPTLFFDVNHMNIRGATLFTKQLNRDLETKF